MLVPSLPQIVRYADWGWGWKRRTKLVFALSAASGVGACSPTDRNIVDRNHVSLPEAFRELPAYRLERRLVTLPVLTSVARLDPRCVDAIAYDNFEQLVRSQPFASQA